MHAAIAVQDRVYNPLESDNMQILVIFRPVALFSVFFHVLSNSATIS